MHPPAAIVYVGSELSEDGKTYYDNFLLLDRSGNLYDLRVRTTISSGTASYGISATKAGTISLRPQNGASMSRMTENLIYISVNGTSSVTLYSYNLATKALETLGTVEGAQSLAILHTDAELTGIFEADEPSEPEQPECDHTNVGAWEYNENGHWKTCECGETVEQGDHEFVEGVCECGYADPNYQPEQPEQPEQPTGTLLHAYVKTESGYAWVQIDSATGAYTVLAEGDTEYFGAGLDGDKLYISEQTDNTAYTEGRVINLVDVINGYTATTNGRGDSGYNTMVDLTASPVKTVVVSGVTVDNAGLPVYVVADAQYLFFMSDYSRRTGKESVELDFSSDTVAIAFVSAVTAADGSSHVENYVVLCENGALYNVEVKFAYNPDYYSVQRSVTLGSYVSTGLNAANGASMTLVGENELYISINTASGVELYSYDLTTNTATKLSTIAAQTLVGLSLLAEIRPDLVPSEPEQPECEHNDVNDWQYDENGHWTTCADCGEIVDEGDHEFEEGVCWCGYEDPNYQPPEPDQPDKSILFHAYVKTESGYAWVMIDSATGEYEVLAEGDTEYTAAGVSNGKIYAADTAYPSYVYQIDPANGYAATKGTYEGAYCTIADIASGSVQSVELTTGTTQVGVPVYIARDDEYGTQYAVAMYNYTSRSASVRTELLVWDAKAVAIAFVSAEMATNGSYYKEKFVVLFDNGNLYDLELTYPGNHSAKVDIALGNYVNTGLTVTSGASMTKVSNNELYISVNTENGVVLYSYNLLTGTTTRRMTMEGLKTLVGLNMLKDVRPELVPEAPGTPENPEEPAIDTWFHAYVKTADGYAWVKINPATGEYEVLAEGYSEYDGGGAADGKIYVSEYALMSQVDPADGYSVSVGAYDSNYGIVMYDLASAPVKSVELTTGTCQVGLPVYVGYSEDYGSQYIAVLQDYTDCYANPSNEIYVYTSRVAAIAFVSAELSADGSSYVERFAVLFQNGDLYHYELTYSEDYIDVYYIIGANTKIASTGLDASNGASMTLVSENMLAISVNTASGVELYSYDLTTDTATKLSTVTGAESLIALSLLSDITGETAQATNVATGSLMSVKVVTGSFTTGDENVHEDVYIADGTVQFNLAETENVTNGMLVITFDPTVLTFQSFTSASVVYAINTSAAAEGKLVVAYAADSAISAGDILASLTFTYEGEHVDTQIVVSTHQRNAEDTVAEDDVVITVCNDPEPHVHNYEAVVTAPNCTEHGFTTYICECGASYVADYVKPLGHDIVTAAGKAATCTEDGWTESSYCRTCGEVLSIRAIILATGHTYEAVVTEPTCTEQGFTTYTCACGDSYVGDYVEATGHSYEAVVTEPTCTEQGYTTYTCACGDTYVGDYVEATGHDYKAVVTEPTCTEEGYTTFTCACGDSYVGAYVPETGHSYEAVVTEPTCIYEGYTTYTCSVCGDSYIDDYVEATDHTYEAVVTAPTCTEEGYTTFTCACGATYVGDYVAATGHNLVDGECTECGHIEYMMGDVNGDGVVDTTDAKLIMQLDLGLIAEESVNLDAADVNGDGVVDTTDAKLIMQLDLGLITEFPKEG